MTRSEAIETAEKIQGWMSRHELEWLYDHAEKSSSVVEIGSWRGRSTYAMLASGVTTLFSVDHWHGSPSEINDCHSDAKTRDIHAEFRASVGSFPNLIVIRNDSETASRSFEDGSVDMVFIDGEHTPEAVERDVKAWLPKTKKLLCGHDRTMPGVAQFLKTNPFPWKEGAGSIWYYEIKQGDPS